MKVVFKIDINKDAKNYYDCANSESKFGRDFTKCIKPEILEKLRGKNWGEVRTEIIKILERGYSADKEKFEKRLKDIENEWKKIEPEFFKRLESLMKCKIYTGAFTCYLTTIGRCPYNDKENWFMANIFWDTDRILIGMAHELMHLQFHHYFNELRVKISENQFQDLKESLTVLLNIEFKDLLKSEDIGYPNHQELRKFISEEWKKEQDFGRLIEIILNKMETEKW
jgi:hypothetical protein